MVKLHFFTIAVSIFYANSLLVLAADFFAPASNIGCYSSISGGDSKGDYNFQSSGYCVTNECPNSPYVAVKGGECICLNSLPQSSSKVNSNQCNQPCPGYLSDKCGGSNVYNIYKGLASSSSSASSNLGSYASSTSSGSGSSSSGSPSSSESSSVTGSSNNSDDSDQSTATVVSTMSNSDGNVIYKTITQEASPTTSSGSSSHASTTSSSSPSSSSTSSSHPSDSTDGKNNGKSEKKSSSSVGAIVGGVVGGIGGLILLVAGGFFYMRYRNNNNDEDEEEEFYNDKPLKRSNGSKIGSRRSPNDLEMPMANPFQHPADDLVRNNSVQKNGFVDPRLNPIMMGRRRLSEGSLVDEADYSRKVLQVANPDDTK